VEDNLANMMLVEQIIEDIPHIHMLSARDGKTGIVLAQEHIAEYYSDGHQFARY